MDLIELGHSRAVGSQLQIERRSTSYLTRRCSLSDIPFLLHSCLAGNMTLAVVDVGSGRTASVKEMMN